MQQNTVEIPEAQFWVVWEVVDMPVHVQRRVPSSWTNFLFLREKWTPTLRPTRLYLALTSCVSLRAFGRISYFLCKGSLRDPRAGSHWKSGHYFFEFNGGVYGGLAVDGFFALKCCIFRAPSVRTDVERHFSESSMAKSSLPSRAPANEIQRFANIHLSTFLSSCQKTTTTQATARHIVAFSKVFV